MGIGRPAWARSLEQGNHLNVPSVYPHTFLLANMVFNHSEQNSVTTGRAMALHKSEVTVL